MDIKREDWEEASGGIVEDHRGGLWRIVGFIDQPTIILDAIPGTQPANVEHWDRKHIVMGSPISEDFFWLRREVRDDL